MLIIHGTPGLPLKFEKVSFSRLPKDAFGVVGNGSLPLPLLTVALVIFRKLLVFFDKTVLVPRYQ